MHRDPVATREQVSALSEQELARIGKLAASICCEGAFDLTDSPISFMESIKEVVKDMVRPIGSAQ